MSLPDGVEGALGIIEGLVYIALVGMFGLFALVVGTVIYALYSFIVSLL